MYGNNFALNMHSKAQQTLKKLEESKALTPSLVGGHSYSQAIFENKTLSDATFLLSLGDALPEDKKQLLFESVTNVYERANELLQEVNAKPRFVSVALQNTLTESTSQNIYASYLTNKINKDFAKPLFEGTLLQDYREESKLIMESIIETGSTEEVNVELFLKYAIFENSFAQGLSDIVLSVETKDHINKFIELQESEYFKIFERNAKVVLEELQENCKILASVLAPSIFEESLQSEEKIDVSSYAGISRVFNK